MHRFTILAYLLAVIHAVGAGTDARSPWMLALLTAITAPVVFLFAYRVLPWQRGGRTRLLALRTTPPTRSPSAPLPTRRQINRST